MNNALIIDSETSGVIEPAIVELAWLKFDSPTSLDDPGESFEQRYNPGKIIGFGAMATHHITNQDVAACPPSSTFKLPKDTGYIIGHNVDFDWVAMGSPSVKRICTLALSRYLWPGTDSHTLGAMIYMLEPRNARALLRDAHSAMSDVISCKILLGHILEKLGYPSTWEGVWLLSEEARLPKVIGFGKHEGTRIAELPLDYRQWILSKPDMDNYLKMAVMRTMPSYQVPAHLL